MYNRQSLARGDLHLKLFQDYIFIKESLANGATELVNGSHIEGLFDMTERRNFQRKAIFGSGPVLEVCVRAKPNGVHVVFPCALNLLVNQAFSQMYL